MLDPRPQAEHSKNLCFISFQSYDESTLRVRVDWEGEGRAPNQVAKLFVALTQWALILEKAPHVLGGAPEFLVLHGMISPAVRASDTTSARGIAAVLSQCPQPERVAEEILEKTWMIRCAETDASASNMKAERLLKLAHDNTTSLQILCMAHRIHSIADRVWALDADTLSGVVHCLLSMQAAGHMLAIEKALLQLVEQRLVIDTQTCRLSQEATSFRQAVMQCFLPRNKFPRKKMRLFASSWDAEQ